MSGMEVIGAISAVISIIDASIKIYEGAQKDSKLSETFKITSAKPWEKTLEACDEKAGKLRQIFDSF
ncbi:hypothetical protein LTR47_012055 [Exophiala xenobiotica]|nr:hypothetical protein LTR47_012055 [Exophiala xenobiotica]KAK5344263.1 hypothetical protein LTR61_011968 [Exophiala xenobiotica]